MVGALSLSQAQNAVRFQNRRRRGRIENAYLYLLPAGLLLALVFAYPTLQSVLLAFRREAGINAEGEYIGLGNFVELAGDPVFWQVAKQTFVWSGGIVFFATILGYALALILNQQFRGRAAFRTLVILPLATSVTVSAMVWRFAFAPDGLVNYTLAGLGSTEGGIPWLANTPQAMVAIIFVGIMVTMPLTAIMLAAAMRSIPRELYDAARIDGASEVVQTLRITLPLTRTMLLVVTLANFVIAFNAFPIIFVMTRGGPLNRTDILATYLYEHAFEFFNFGLASAVAVVILVTLLILSVSYVHLFIHRTKVG